jgi:DNA-binding transcriptional ArsR family regulator
VTAQPQGIADLQALESVFGALAHQSRRTILLVLLARGGEMTSGDIAARFDCSWPTTTRHLRILQDAGLVRVVLRGRQRVYRLDTGRLREVAGGWLARFEPPSAGPPGDDAAGAGGQPAIGRGAAGQPATARGAARQPATARGARRPG